MRRVLLAQESAARAATYQRGHLSLSRPCLVSQPVRLADRARWILGAARIQRVPSAHALPTPAAGGEMMSPNGRRAWRKWVRRVEHNPKLRPPGKSISRLAREGKRHLGSIPPTPPKPFTTRSLVGMTMGARKRLRRAISKLLDRAHGNLASLGYQHDADRDDYFLRIGERLRPCPGCFDCAVECWVCHEPHEPPDELCDGSGVIRAGKLRPLLRKRDCGFYID